MKCEDCGGSLMMFSAPAASRIGRVLGQRPGKPRCPSQIRHIRLLSTTRLQKVLRMLMGIQACFIFLRKYSLCWALFVIPEVLIQFRSCEICTLRNLMFSPSPLMLRGACSDCVDNHLLHFVCIEHQIVFSAPLRCLTSSVHQFLHFNE